MGVFDKEESILLNSCVFKPYATAGDWACKYRRNAYGEPFSYADFPFLKEPTDAMSDIASNGMVVIKSCAQIGKSTAIENFIGWMCEFHRSNSLIVFEGLKTAQRFVKQRLQPFLKRNAGLNWRRFHSAATSENESNNLSAIGLGHEDATLFVGTASSPSDLCSMPARFIIMDELDRWPYELRGEGDPVTLALKRGLNFKGINILTSTPTIEQGRINCYFKQGTMETWCAVCDCGEHMPVEWDLIDFTKDIPTYSCKNCGAVYAQKDIMKLDHRYRPPQNDTPVLDRFGRKTRSFEIFGTLHHSRYTWEGLKKDELEATRIGIHSLRSFINTSIGDIFKQVEITSGDIDAKQLMDATRTDYTFDTLPDDIDFIVMGCDTHDSCLYAETVGFSANLRRMYGIFYEVLKGDPSEQAVWDDLEASFDRRFKRKDGTTLRPRLLFIDSGGHRSNDVIYNCTTSRYYGFWIPCRGYMHAPSQTIQHESPILYRRSKVMRARTKRKCYMQVVHVGTAKDSIHYAHSLTISGDKHVFYPNTPCYDLGYFEGLLCEKRDIHGRWSATPDRSDKGKAPNEPIDCRVYALGAAHYYKTWFYTSDIKRKDTYKEEYKPDEKKEQDDKKSVDNVNLPVKQQDKRQDGTPASNDKRKIHKW